MGVLCDTDLMISHGGVKKPHPKATAEREVDGRVAAGDRISNWLSNRIERNIIDAEAPHKIVDVADMLLVWLRRKKGFEQPFTVMDLTDVTHFLERSDALAHDWNFARTIVDFLDGDWTR